MLWSVSRGHSPANFCSVLGVLAEINIHYFHKLRLYTVVSYHCARRLKDGGVINKAGSTLEIRSATLNDSGLYRCQAASTSGKKLSKIAQLQVKGMVLTH